eukprot:2045472-Pleurochrysis_carterae.AAC.1
MPLQGGTPHRMPERGVTASPAGTGKSQLWARPWHPQLVERLGRRFTSPPASAPRATPLPFVDSVLRRWQTRLRLGYMRGRVGRRQPPGCEAPMLTDSRIARTTSPRSPRRCASATACERACRWRCAMRSPSAG